MSLFIFTFLLCQELDDVLVFCWAMERRDTWVDDCSVWTSRILAPIIIGSMTVDFVLELY